MTAKQVAPAKSKRNKLLTSLLIITVIYTIVGFLVVPAIIKSQLLKRLPALTHRNPAIDEVKFNPYALTLTLRGFSLKETNGSTFASFGEFYANFQPCESILTRTWVLDDLHLFNSTFQIIYQADGSFNFANLSPTNAPAPAATNTPSKGLPGIRIRSLSISNASIAFDDLTRSPAFHTTIAPLNFALTNFTTVRGKNSPYTFAATTESGEAFDWAGHITVDPVRSRGSLKITGIKLPKYGIYGKDFEGFELASGTLDLVLNYNYDSASNSTDCSVSNSTIKLSNLEIKSPGTGETILAIPALSIEGIEASLPNHSAKVALIKSSNGSILLRQDKNGQLNIVSLLMPQATPATRKAATPQESTFSSTPQFDALIDEIDFSNYTVRFNDQQPPKPADFKLDQIAFNLKGASNRTNAPVNSRISMRFQDTGNIQVEGLVTPMPPSADLQLAVSNIDLRAFQPYVEQQIKLAITSGTFQLKGHARYLPPEPGASKISFDGDMAINKFATTDDILFRDFTTFDALQINGINFRLQPDKLHVNEIKFVKLNTSLIIGPDHKSNLQNILRNQISSQTNASPVASSSASASKPFDFSLGTFSLENASLHFVDQSIEPNGAFDIQEFGGDVKDLSLGGNSTAVIDLRGRVDDRSPFGINGKLRPTPGDLFTDISVNFTNTELTAFTTYMEKFAGRPLQKGKFSFGVHYLVEGNSLKAENGFYIDQLTLGQKNESTNATSLPVKLAVALLKDRRGRIQLDIPLSGRLDDPKFRIGPVIWQVVLNLITKAATSPFSLLGAALGGGDELSFVTFDAGQTTIPSTETNKLEMLCKALYEHPELTLEISGSVDVEKDRAPLAQARLEQQLKTLKARHLVDAGQPAVAVEQIQIAPAEYTSLLGEAYKTAFAETNRATGTTNNASIKTKKKPKIEGTNPKIGEVSPDASAITNMESRLKDMIVISDDEWLAIINKRAASVQSYLLGTGKVTEDRLFITRPKTTGASSKGADKVTLTLD